MAEKQNIAHALYVDISNTEDILNSSMSNFLNNSNILNSPSMVMFDSHQYYNAGGLYYIFGKDISRFDSSTSEDLYDFYSEVIYIESLNENILKTVEKWQNGENVSQYENRYAF